MNETTFDGRRGLSRRQLLSALGVGTATSLAGCGSSGDGNGNGGSGGGTDTSGEQGIPEETDELPSVSGSYDTVTGASFTTLNPLYNTESGAGTAIGRALDQGYTFDSNREYFPLLYDMTTDEGEVWVFEIREGLTFSDPYGSVDAESFVYLIEELHQSDWANTASAANWAGVTVERTGDLEFQAELQQPRLLWPESFDPLLFPIPKGLLEPYVEAEDTEGLQQDEELLELEFTGNLGPYTLEEWERGAGTSYTRNDEYYLREIEAGPDLFGNAPYFEEATIDVVEEQASRLGALETGEADSASIPPERFEDFESNSDINVFQVPQPFNQILSVNMRDNGWNAGPGNLFRITEFRQAIACAINKEELIGGVYRGLAQPHFTWQPRFSEFYPGDEAISTFGTGDLYGPDPARERAEAAFEQSEFDYGFDGDALVTPENEQTVLDLYYSTGSETSQLVAEFVAEELNRNLGIEVEIEAIDGVRFDRDFWTAEPEGGTDTIDGETVEWDAPTPNNPGPRSVTSNEAWDMSLVFGLNTYPLNPLTNRFFFDGPDARYNPVGYYPEFDAEELFRQAGRARTEDELATAFEEIFINLASEQPYVMLLFSDSITGYTADLRGPTEDFSNGWDFAGWYLED
ncbi:ABC transporter substrate-binding protein [Natronomonas sp. F2-12]|uniref:ABC transporter substrate-binding protein n=1 Tax=Natronomonas aquatica TaxID=2841590 RepID=A0A9R1D3A7_9EURY|nr:ABC transporter substrate-binding protein [Natronomonas aquatica]MCQ4332129.1 ABC transporter substrate-binding protein [Natronomonas aquatica]